jgi:hypothetical protein
LKRRRAWLWICGVAADEVVVVDDVDAQEQVTESESGGTPFAADRPTLSITVRLYPDPNIECCDYLPEIHNSPLYDTVALALTNPVTGVNMSGGGEYCGRISFTKGSLIISPQLR